MRALSALAGLLLLWGCTVPTLESLEAERPRACDGAHPCASGYQCQGGVCVRGGGGGECSGGATQACGSAVGECVPGTQACGQDLRWGACVGAVEPVAEVCDGKDNDCDGQVDEDLATLPACALQSGVCAGKRRRCVGGTVEAACVGATYGADYEATESRCDGLDNDCDGQVDEGLTSTCPLQQGVCAGATVACAAFRDGGCTAAAYAARSSQYEVFETSCDGVDNDCDGQADAWALQNLSGTPTAASIRPAAARLSGGAVLVLWQEASQLRARAVGVDGALTAPLAPSSSAEAALVARSPALASDGALVWGIWLEDTAAAGLQAMAAPLSASGRSTLADAGALQVSAGALTEVAIAADDAAGRALAAVVKGGSVELAAFAGNALAFTNVAARPGRAPQVAPAGGGLFWLAYETTSGSTVCLVDAATAGIPLSCTALPPAGAKSPSPQPLAGSAPFAAAVAALVPQDGGLRVASFDCDAGVCAGASAPPTFSALASGLRAAAVVRNQRPVFFTLEDANPNPAVYRSLTDGGFALAAPALSASHRPVPLLLGASRPAVVFDTEGNTGGAVPDGEVVLQRFCAP